MAPVNPEWLEEVAAIAGELEYRPSKAEFTERASITGAAFYRYFDSWAAVLDAAAAATNEPALTIPRESLAGGHNRLSRDELLADLRAGREALGKIPSMPEYEAMGEYSASTYQRRFGSWYAALVAAFGDDVPEDRRHDYPATDTGAEK